jgi:hypothetical protein
VAWLGVHRQSTKFQITPFFSYAKNIHEAGKTTCYSTKPIHISHVIAR